MFQVGADVFHNVTHFSTVVADPVVSQQCASKCALSRKGREGCGKYLVVAGRIILF